MNNKNYRTGFVITLVLTLVGIIALSILFMQLSTTKNALAFTENQLSTTQIELTTTQSNLDTTQGQLTTTQGQLTATQGQLTTTQNNLAAKQNELTMTLNTLATTQSDLKAAQIQEASLQTSLTATLSQVTNLQNQLSSGYILNDPTYASMEAFITSDTTNQNTYVASTYNCVNFADDVITNAAKQHIRCAFVYIDFASNSSHACVAFNTTDKGMVYIEPQNDDIVQLAVGSRYYREEIPPSGYYIPQPSYNDTVTRFVVIW